MIPLGLHFLVYKCVCECVCVCVCVCVCEYILLVLSTHPLILDGAVKLNPCHYQFSSVQIESAARQLKSE